MRRWGGKLQKDSSSLWSVGRLCMHAQLSQSLWWMGAVTGAVPWSGLNGFWVVSLQGNWKSLGSAGVQLLGLFWESVDPIDSSNSLNAALSILSSLLLCTFNVNLQLFLGLLILTLLLIRTMNELWFLKGWWNFFFSTCYESYKKGKPK